MGVDMLFILLLALILFGPKRLPEIARQIGKFVAEFKRASNDFKYQFQAEIDKASIAELTASPRAAKQSSPSIPTLLPPAETTPALSTPESEHERLMRTARMAYEAQTFTLRPPEPPPVAHGTQLHGTQVFAPSNPLPPQENRSGASSAAPVAVPTAQIRRRPATLIPNLPPTDSRGPRRTGELSSHANSRDRDPDIRVQRAHRTAHHGLHRAP